MSLYRDCMNASYGSETENFPDGEPIVRAFESGMDGIAIDGRRLIFSLFNYSSWYATWMEYDVRNLVITVH